MKIRMLYMHSYNVFLTVLCPLGLGMFQSQYKEQTKERAHQPSVLSHIVLIRTIWRTCKLQCIHFLCLDLDKFYPFVAAVTTTVAVAVDACSGEFVYFLRAGWQVYCRDHTPSPFLSRATLLILGLICISWETRNKNKHNRMVSGKGQRNRCSSISPVKYEPRSDQLWACVLETHENCVLHLWCH